MIGGRLPGVRRATATWSPVRLRFAGLAVLTAALTGALAVGAAGGLGPSGAFASAGALVYAAAAYVVLVVLALFIPAGVTVQVIAGQLLVGALLIGRGDPSPLFSTPLGSTAVLAGVVVTAELLGVVARLDTPLRRDGGDALPRAGLAALVAAGVFGVALLVSAVPGPTGLVAVGLASAACFALAVQMARGVG